MNFFDLIPILLKVSKYPNNYICHVTNHIIYNINSFNIQKILTNSCLYRGEPEYIETILFPSTGEDSQSQYVCVTLVVRLPSGYPDISPIINLRNPRGLDESTVKLMQSDAEAKCKNFIGQPVMFELIEVKKSINHINFIFVSVLKKYINKIMNMSIIKYCFVFITTISFM